MENDDQVLAADRGGCRSALVSVALRLRVVMWQMSKLAASSYIGSISPVMASFFAKWVPAALALSNRGV